MVSVVLYPSTEGSSDQRAAAAVAELWSPGAEVLPIPLLEDLISTVESTSGVLGIVPLEDSLHGEYSKNIELLINRTDQSQIAGVFTLEETISGFSCSADAPIRTVHGHPLIIDSFRPLIGELGLDAVPVANSSQACRLVAENERVSECALAPIAVGTSFPLQEHSSFAPHRIAVLTRYGVLSRDPISERRTSERNTLVLFWPSDDQTGTLLNLVTEVAKQQMNMISIRSRPMGIGQSHSFVVELEQDPESRPFQSAIAALAQLGVRYKILGSFDRLLEPVIGMSSQGIPRLVTPNETSTK